MATTATDSSAVALTIREIASTDAPAVAELSTQLGYATSTADMQQRIQSILPLSSGHAAYVAVLDNHIVGWIEAEIVRHLQTPPHTIITGLVVRDGVRSHGIGSRLCAEVEAWTRQQGIATIRVTSRMTRERAHRFYLREGFTQTKTSAVFEKALT
ncbi:GNAT family N-acetyltransferase [Edaphobacter flagellatus]|uniref:GNAT family N-acetyltransferase n=1 Tax=Edaphobacter flagellatus TaxID=1933044 RepID=UPI0021B4A27F|nr:GNAT family N-acetyltransferase [Edaphobacter flagellatus]